MATITSTPTLSKNLTINKKNKVTATISWSTPDIPSNVTIISCILTGTSVVNMSKGSCTVEVNDVEISQNSNFSIDLGNDSTIKSVEVSAQGDTGQSSGTVSFTNLLYTITYEEKGLVIKNIYIGSVNVDNINIGNVKIIRTYVGEDMIYENE